MIERKIKLVDAVLPDKKKVGVPAGGLQPAWPERHHYRAALLRL